VVVGLQPAIPGYVKKKPGRKSGSALPYIIDPETRCWVWQRAKNHRGYGLMWNGAKMVTAHRHFYTILRGDVPAGMQLDHKCRNRACCNPFHLEIVTGTENVRRGNATKLNAEQVQQIRDLAGEGVPQRELGRRFGVSSTQVRRIVRGTRWAPTPSPSAPGSEVAR
jgi:hypothetical protein